MKTTSRRAFVKLTGGAVGSGFLGGHPALGGGSSQRRFKTVIRQVPTTAGRQVVHGSGVTGNGPFYEIMVDGTIDLIDLARMAGPVRVSGTAFSFQRDGLMLAIRQLPSQAFDAALQEIGAGEGQLFAHEAVCYEPAAGRTDDPYAQSTALDPSGKPSLKPIGHQCRPSEAYGRLLDGAIDASLFGLVHSRESDALTRKVTCRITHNIEEARTVVTATIDRIAAAADALEPRELEAWMASPLVDSSFRLVQGRSSRDFSRSFARLARKLSNFASPSVWLALAAGGVNDGGAIHRALTAEHPYYADRTRAALSGALEILHGKMLPTSHEVEDGRGTRFDDWMAEAFGATAGSAFVDADGDGVPNLVEYALGGDPVDHLSAPSPQLGAEAVDGEQYLTLSYIRDTRLEDVEYVVQGSTDLEQSEWTSEGVIDEVVTAVGEMEARRARVSMGGRQRYLRLLIRR